MLSRGRLSVIAVIVALCSPWVVSAQDGTGKLKSVEPVNGLQLTVTAESSTWTVGTTMMFDATLKNVGDRSFLIDLFGDLDERYEGKRSSTIVLSCWALSWGKALGPSGPQRGRMRLEPSQFARLAPGESYTKRLSLRLCEFPPGSYHIRLAYAPRTAAPSFSIPDGWLKQHQLFSDPMWIGMVFSNALAMDVVSESHALDQRRDGGERTPES